MKKKFLFFVFLASVAVVNAQTNFSGNWGTPQLEMVDGIQYSNAVPIEINIIQTKDSIKLTTLESIENAKPYTQTLPLNGKAMIRFSLSSKRTITSTISWSADKKSLARIVLISYAEKPTEVEFKNTEVWELNDEGNLVITKTSDATVTDDWTIKATYMTQ